MAILFQCARPHFSRSQIDPLKFVAAIFSRDIKGCFFSQEIPGLFTFVFCLQTVTRTLGRVTLLRKRLPFLGQADDSMTRNYVAQPGATQHATRRKWRRGSNTLEGGQLGMRRGGSRDSDEIEADRRRHHHHHKYRNRYKVGPLII